MSLAPGTALQNGHYVVDALLEAAPNGDLYWGTHVVTGMQVFIQVFPVSAESNSSDLSSLIARFEGVAFSPQSPLPNPFQLFHGEDQTLCLAMSATVGLPWTSLCATRPPMKPQQALKLIRQIADSVTWLKAQGIVGLDLSPNRVWLSEDGDRLTLTGLPQAHLNVQPDTEAQPDTTVQFLARLLYSFLLGELPTEAAAEELKTALNQKLPTLSSRLVQAIVQGAQGTEAEEAAISLQPWLDQLPDAAGAYSQRQPESQLARRPVSAAARPSRSKLYSALVGTASLAAIAGIAFGTFWRLNARSLPGAIQFEPDQSFPSQADWAGDRPDVSFDAPYVPAQANPVRREDWYESDWGDTAEENTWEAPVESDWSTVDEDSTYESTDYGDGDSMGGSLDPVDASVGDESDTPNPDTAAEEPVDNVPNREELLDPDNLPQDVSSPLLEPSSNSSSTDVSEPAS